MRNLILPLALAVVAAGCTTNTSPGNDREAELEPRAPAAQVVSADAAISGVAPGLLKPQTMTDVDLGNVPQVGGGCRFRMTRVGFPVFVYGASAGVVKLNDKLIRLPGLGDGRYSADGVEAMIRPLGERVEDGSLLASEFILRLPGAPNEMGFHGFSNC